MYNMPLACICGGWIEFFLISLGISSIAAVLKRRKHKHCSNNEDHEHCEEDK